MELIKAKDGKVKNATRIQVKCPKCLTMTVVVVSRDRSAEYGREIIQVPCSKCLMYLMIDIKARKLLPFDEVTLIQTKSTTT